MASLSPVSSTVTWRGPASRADIDLDALYLDGGKNESRDLPWRERLKHFTIPWYLLTMSTGGLAGLLASQPHAFRGLFTIGKTIFIFDLVLFIIITALQIHRFARWPHMFMTALKNPAEALFVPSLVLSLEGIISGTQAFGGPSTGTWLYVTVYVLFWIYVALAILCALAVYSYLFTARRLTVHSMTPAWLLPILACNLTGALAGSLAAGQTPFHRVPLLVAGLTLQGLGFWVSIPLLGVWITHLMSDGLPKAATRPGMFVAAAPAGYTAYALLHMANAIPLNESYFARHDHAKEMIKTMALIFSVFIWCMSFFLFLVALVAIVSATIDRQMSFHLTWYSFVFPNIGFTQATISIGQALDSQAVTWVATGMTLILVTVYIFVLLAHIRAVWKRQILWPGRDEDAE
ncbi:voltage-dependent anion channel [Kockovaella imperatae]|uniref:Voltage-dependent anion channel n=1 Tax=Kockovaella imperatae TaxID=4999 RepID=A0A1Y1UBP2_9TREE|nr:voltage-dependent anion channel [Kockovaella imperatae]ORX35468.1 voltage-dependent anion channel [Kockovaella imperatae]